MSARTLAQRRSRSASERIGGCMGGFGMALHYHWVGGRQADDTETISGWSECGLDRLDAEVFVLMILSRVCDRPLARLRASLTRYGRRRFAPPLTRSSTRTECYPSDQGRFLGGTRMKLISTCRLLFAIAVMIIVAGGAQAETFPSRP